MAQICMLYYKNHKLHVSLLRELNSILANQHIVTIIDKPSSVNERETNDYQRIYISHVKLKFLRVYLWKLLRPLCISPLDEVYWTSIVILEDLLTIIKYFMDTIRCSCDLLYAHDIWTVLPALVAAKIKKIPVIYDAHEINSEQGDPTKLYNRIIHKMEVWLIPKIDQVIVPNYQRARLVKEEWRLNTHIDIIKNCPPLIEIATSNRIRDELGWSDDINVVLYHGSFLEWRNLEKLILSVQYYIASTRLVLIGKRNEYFTNTLSKLIKDHDLTPSIGVIGYIPHDEIWEYISSADIGVVIYKNSNLNNYYCSPLKLYEYVMARIPVVACDFPPIRDFINYYPVGLTFDAEDPKSIAQSVNRLLLMKENERMGMHEAMNIARSEFNWEVEGKLYMNVLSRNLHKL
jgi:glycosyltransferase involved in cell wall biosynthesis